MDNNNQFSKALDLKFDSDIGKTTARQYLQKLLEEVWTKAECFDAKRPFGMSDHEWVLVGALVKAKFLKGKLDEDGCLEDYPSKADAFVVGMIREMCKP